MLASVHVLYFVHCQTGYVAIGGEEYMIEPIKGHPNASADDADQRFGQHQREHPHLIYKRSALNAADEKTDDDDGHGTCGNDGLSCLLFTHIF